MLASNAPYEVVEILVNSATYGGGGIYGLYSTVAADSVWAPYIFIHEFGHHLAALADEYYTSDVAYLAGHGSRRAVGAERHRAARSGEREVEGSRHARHGAPDRVAEGGIRAVLEEHPGAPSADPRSEPARIRDGRALQRGAGPRNGAAHDGPDAHRVGAFEGANYEARGFYRPQADCIMFTRDNVPFCAVCRRAIEAIIDLYSRN